MPVDPRRAGDDGRRLPDHARRGQPRDLSRWCWSGCSCWRAGSPSCRSPPTRSPPRSAIRKGSHFRLTLQPDLQQPRHVHRPVPRRALFLKGVEVKEGTVITPVVRAAALAGIDRAYFWICGLIIAAAGCSSGFAPDGHRAAAAPSARRRGKGIGALISDALTSRWALFGGAAIFLYVGAEVAIGTQMALFLNDNAIWGHVRRAVRRAAARRDHGQRRSPGVSLAGSRQGGRLLLGRGDGRPRDRLGAAGASSTRRSCSRPSPRSPARCASTSSPSAA